MSEIPNLSLPQDFHNIVRLFPLPNVVLFPGVVQALHLFEPRYREMMDDALHTDELIAMAYLNGEGFGSESGVQPSVAPIVCVGKILSHTQLEDGRYNVFLIGAKRARIVRELPMEALYRTAEIEVVEDNGASLTTHHLRKEIVLAFRELVAQRAGWDAETLEQFLSQDLPFGQLVDMICYSCGASSADQQSVLEAVELSKRGELVLELLRTQVEGGDQQTESDQPDSGRSFPPDFSVN